MIENEVHGFFAIHVGSDFLKSTYAVVVLCPREGLLRVLEATRSMAG